MFGEWEPTVFTQRTVNQGIVSRDEEERCRYLIGYVTVWTDDRPAQTDVHILEALLDVIEVDVIQIHVQVIKTGVCGTRQVNIEIQVHLEWFKLHAMLIFNGLN